MRAGFVITGTEVLTGIIRDRNGPWLSDRLADKGVELAHIVITGDRPDDLTAALEFLRGEGVDLIVTSGGLGPTADDMTAEVVAGFAGRPLQVDEDLERRIGEIVARFARRWRIDSESLAIANRKQAMVPEGAVALDPVGTAPGLVVPAGEQTVVVLPGPPRELQESWAQAIETDLFRSAIDGAPVYTTRTLRLFGLPESEIAATLREVGPSWISSSWRSRPACAGASWRSRFAEAPDDALAEQVVTAIADRHSDTIFFTRRQQDRGAGRAVS